MANYQDKEFKELYAEILEDVKSITTKWDPSISDESDPGVALLKAWTLFFDKLQYKINYRNAQNSVRRVTDRNEAKELFFDLGYQLKQKRSASGDLLVRGLSSLPQGSILPLFCQFSDQSGSLIYTSVRAQATLNPGSTNLIEVQEGVPLRYQYLEKTDFNETDLTNNLRLVLYGVNELSQNGVVICTKRVENGERKDPIVSDWLNVENNPFTFVETSNIFSIGHNPEGTPYIQFYEESLPSLRNGVEIWILSSAGAAGNCSANKITRVVTTLEGISSNSLQITHPDFVNGQNPEPLTQAKNNYYDSFGVNETLVSERDYSQTLRTSVDENLEKLCSQALVTGVEGYHNLVEIISKLESGTQTRLVKLLNTLTSKLFVDALKTSNNYYDSFTHLSSNSTDNLIKKALYKKGVVSNDLTLVDGPGDAGTEKSQPYDRIWFDIAGLAGTVITNSQKTTKEIEDEIISAISAAYNSKNLKLGEQIPVSEISSIVKSLPEVVEAAFYYTDDHKLANSIRVEGETPIPIVDKGLTDEGKIDLIARMAMAGKTKLFDEVEIPMVFGGVIPTITSTGNTNPGPWGYFPNKKDGATSTYIPDPSYVITQIIGKRAAIQGEGDAFTLKSNEMVQFYTKLLEDQIRYGLGVGYRLVSQMRPILESRIETATLLAGTLIKKDSKIYSELDPTQMGEGVVTVESDGGYTFNKDYTVQEKIEITGGSTKPSTLASGSMVYDKSIIVGTINGKTYTNDKPYYNLTIPKNIDTQIPEGAVLLLQPDDSGEVVKLTPGTYIKTSFDLNSDGTILQTGTTVLGSGQEISKRAYSELTLNQTYLYGVITNSGEPLLLEGGKDYILQEGEHLIYSDHDLIDFIDFGSGTLLSSSTDLKLNNLVTLDNFNRSLQSLPGEITISSTLIQSFVGSNYQVNGLPKLNGFYPFEWKGIENTVVITDPTGKKKINEFNSDYKVRFGLLLNTGLSKTLQLEQNQSLAITATSLADNGQQVTFNTSSGNIPVITFSSPISTGGVKTVIPKETNLSLVSYQLRSFNGSIGIDDPQLSFSGGRVNLVIATPSNSEGSTQLQLGGGLFYLTKFTIEKGTLELTRDANIRFLVCNKNSTWVTDVNGLTGGDSPIDVLIRTTGNGGNLKFILGPDTTVRLENFRQIKDFSTDLGTTTTGVTNEVVFNKINSYLIDGSTANVKMDFWFTPGSSIKNPADVLSFYDQDHIMNRNVLTLLDLSTLRADKNLRIIRRNK